MMGLFCLGCERQSDLNQNHATTAEPVTVGHVGVKDLVYRLHRVGSLEAKASVMVRTEVEGRVTDLFFEEGATVTAGQVLVKIDDAKIRTIMSQLEARLHQLEIQLSNRLKTLERKKPLLAHDLVSQQDFDDLQTKIDVEKAAVLEIKAQIAHHREILDDTEIRAPFGGVTSERLISVGDFLSTGDPIVRVVRLDPLEISFRVDEKYKSSLSLNQPVAVTVAAYPDKTFSGEIFFISPDIDIQTRTFLMKGRIPNNDHLLSPGMFAEVSVITETHKDALVVPWESVVQLEDEAYVYVCTGNEAKKIPVTVGLVAEGMTEVFGDLEPGQQVVVEGKYSLSDEAKVTIKTGSNLASSDQR